MVSCTREACQKLTTILAVGKQCHPIPPSHLPLHRDMMISTIWFYRATPPLRPHPRNTIETKSCRNTLSIDLAGELFSQTPFHTNKAILIQPRCRSIRSGSIYVETVGSLVHVNYGTVPGMVIIQGSIFATAKARDRLFANINDPATLQRRSLRFALLHSCQHLQTAAKRKL